MGLNGYAAHVTGDQGGDLADGPCAHQACRRQPDANGTFERVFDPRPSANPVRNR